MSAQSDARVASACRELRECALPPCPALPSPPLRARCSCLVMSREQGTRGKDAIASVEAAGQSRRVGFNAAVAPVRHCTSRQRSGAPNRGAVASGGRDRVVQSEQRWKAQHGPKRGRSPRRPPSAARPAVRHARLAGGRHRRPHVLLVRVARLGRAPSRGPGRMRISSQASSWRSFLRGGLSRGSCSGAGTLRCPPSPCAPAPLFSRYRSQLVIETLSQGLSVGTFCRCNCRNSFYGCRNPYYGCRNPHAECLFPLAANCYDNCGPDADVTP